MEQKLKRVRKVNIKKALSTGFREGYYHLGFIVYSTAITFLISFGLCWGAMNIIHAIGSKPIWNLLYLPGVITAWIGALGIMGFVHKVIYNENPVISEVWLTIRIFWKKALLLLLADLLISTILICDLAYCIILAGSRGGLFVSALAAFCFYIILFWSMTTLYHMPMLVDGGEDTPVLKILQRSAVLSLINPGYTILVFIVIIALGLICALPALAGWVALFLGASSFICCSALKELYQSYGIVPDDVVEIEDKGWRTPDN